MSVNYAYNYAVIDLASGMCIHFRSTSLAIDPLPENYVEIPVNDPEYLGKYYLNGSWWEDAEGTIPWESSLL